MLPNDFLRPYFAQGIHFQALAVLVSYLIGSVPFAYLWVRLAKGIDIRTVGSGNVGATNAGRAMGSRGVAVAVFALDVAKGFAPVALIPPELQWLRIACGAAAFAGHLFPVYLGFKGGKGVATGFGVLLALCPVPALAALGVWALSALGTRYVSLASITAATFLPIFIYVYRTEYLGPVFGFTLACAAVVIYKHLPNIRRLAAGTEPKIGQKKTEAGA